MTATIATLALAAFHWTTPPAHCGHHHQCILSVARYECRAWHDPPHCRIAWRADHHATPAPSSSSSSSSPPTSSFDQCVAYRESSGNPNATSGPYWGLYQFDAPTWQEATAGMGVTWPYGTATPAEQTAVFDYWSARYPTAWPNTIPACGGR